MLYAKLSFLRAYRGTPRPSPLSRHASAWLVALLSIALFAGCATGSTVYIKTIAGGERLRFPMEGGRVEKATAEGVTVLITSLAANSALHKIAYVFELEDRSNRPLRSVRVEDVSEDSVFLLWEDLQPKLTDRHWRAVSQPMGPDDPGQGWFLYLDDSFRVYRFTLTRTDGTTVVLHQGALVPAWAKAGVRRLFGKKE